MIPAKTRKSARKDRLQQARRRRGAEWETVLVLNLNRRPDTWAVLLPKSWTGQPFDITAVQKGRAMAIECKRIARGNLPYSCFTENEKEHLSRFEDAGGLAYVAVWRDSDNRCALIPWKDIRAEVLGGVRGSARLEEHPFMISIFREEAAPCE